MWSRLRQWALGSTPPTDLAQPLAVEHWLWAAGSRHGKRQGHIEIRGLAFRHSEQHPYLYRDFHLEVPPGSTVAIVGASGSGKSTLAKLLQGF